MLPGVGNSLPFCFRGQSFLLISTRNLPSCDFPLLVLSLKTTKKWLEMVLPFIFFPLFSFSFYYFVQRSFNVQLGPRQCRPPCGVSPSHVSEVPPGPGTPSGVPLSTPSAASSGLLPLQPEQTPSSPSQSPGFSVLPPPTQLSIQNEHHFLNRPLTGMSFANKQEESADSCFHTMNLKTQW